MKSERVLYNLIIYKIKKSNLVNIASTIIIILSIVTLWSCGESTSINTTPIKDYLPLQIGNYWIYNSYELNSEGLPIGSTQEEDSLVVEYSGRVSGMDAFYLVKYKNNIPFDTMFVAKNNNRIWILNDSTSTSIPALIPTWFPVVDFSISLNDNWNVAGYLVDNYPYTIDGQVYSGVYNHTINGKLDFNDSIIFNGIKYMSKKYENKYDSRLNFAIVNKITLPNGGWRYDTTQFNRLEKYFDRYHLLEGAGFYQIRREPHSVGISTNPSSTLSSSQQINGKESLLVRFGKK